MILPDLAHIRLHQQHLLKPQFTKPEEVVRSLGAVQAQDFLGSLWTIGQRMQKATELDIENAIAGCKIVRTWPMRGTLHFVLPQNVRWMQKLLTPRVLARAQGNYRTEGLDKTTFTKSRKLIEKVLAGGNQLTRDELYEVLEQTKIKLGGQRGLHLLNNAAQQGLICMGPRKGKQHSFVLVDEWIPTQREWSVDESLAELARIYFSSHAPATIADFAWWTGLTLTEAKKAIEISSSTLTSTVVDRQTYWMNKDIAKSKWNSPNVSLLSWFDEYIISYKDRSAAFDPATKKFITNPKNGIYSSVIVVDGKIAGNWKRTFAKGKVEIEVKPFRTFTQKEKVELEKVIARYRKFVVDTAQ